MTESTLIAIIATTGPIVSTILAVVLPPLIRKKGKSSVSEATRPRRLGFFQILCFGVTITAIIVTFMMKRQLASVTEKFSQTCENIRVTNCLDGRQGCRDYLRELCPKSSKR
jgi:hypothetical protein